MKSQLENLYRRTGITKESCFQAARRLDTHNSLSLWALTTLAFCLIVISLLTQIYSENKFIQSHEKFLDFAMTAMSILALVISIVVSKSDFALRADKFRRQAMEINELRLSFVQLIKKDPISVNELENLYTKNSAAYSSILARNLVHNQIDYHISSTTGIEQKYFLFRMLVSEFTGYVLIIALALLLLSWACFNTYMQALL